jgi:hypothetical protein
MASHRDLDDRLMEIFIGVPECTLEDIVLKCPDLTWNQVFWEVDRLNRQGQVFLKKKGAGVYTVTRRTPVVAAKSALHIH